MKRSTPPADELRDPGLQPERTVLAWGRTMATMLAVAAFFLRWVQHHGLFTLALCAGALLVAGSIFASQRRRYRRAVLAVAEESGAPGPLPVLATALTTGALGLLGIYAITL